MPVDYKKYPKDWKNISLRVRELSNWTCQQCGRPCRIPGESWANFRLRLPVEWHLEFERRNRFTLTVAHLDHDTSNSDLSNLRALCSVCHLRYDAKFHADNRRKRQENARTT